MREKNCFEDSPTYLFVEFLPPSTALLYWVWPEVTLTLYIQNIKSFHVIFVFFAQFLKLILKTPTISDIFLLVTTCQKLVRWSQIKRWKYHKYEKVNTLHWWRFLYNYERYFWWRRESELYKLFLHHAKEKQYCFWI